MHSIFLSLSLLLIEGCFFKILFYRSYVSMQATGPRPFLPQLQDDPVHLCFRYTPPPRGNVDYLCAFCINANKKKMTTGSLLSVIHGGSRHRFLPRQRPLDILIDEKRHTCAGHHPQQIRAQAPVETQDPILAPHRADGA
jgi:hypothetical protein